MIAKEINDSQKRWWKHECDFILIFYISPYMCGVITSIDTQTVPLWYSSQTCTWHSCAVTGLFLPPSAFAVSTAPRLPTRRWRIKERGGTRTPSWVWPTRWPCRCRCCPRPPPCPAPPRRTWVSALFFIWRANGLLHSPEKTNFLSYYWDWSM